MCGATTQQRDLQEQQAAFYKQGTQQQSQVYGEDQEILQAMQKVYSPILTAGPNQEGYSDAEKTDLNTQATEGTATGYGHAAEALGENLAAAGGGNDFLPTGTDTQLKAGLLASGAKNLSDEQLQIKNADYEKGYQTWLNAGQMMGNTAGLLNPTGYSGAATGAGVAAGNTADQIASENNSWMNAAIGAASSLGSAALSRP